ncbi:timeless isoform X2 [Musca autumnalis]|uniref:timeless isoform X2 n=1 Tax=Musca autumnalis TaxID=221902 RepID=UPI003CECFF92
MDWLLETPQLYSAFSSLGSLMGDNYIVSDKVLETLEEIDFKLTYEDQTLRTFRRAVGFGKNVKSDLLPLLENAKDEEVFDSVIRILVNLTAPVECLFSVDVMYRTEVGRYTIFELNNLLHTSKDAFTDPKSTKCVVEYMTRILESDSKLSAKKCEQINNCLLLLRNILHIPEPRGNYIMSTQSHNQSGGTHPVSMQNTILWNLFIQSIDKLLLYLMTCPQRAVWGVTLVQLIALMYKDQHVSTLQKLLNMWFEASLSESSEDNESNTSPPKQGSCDSSPMLTSDPTSDSSDNGSGGTKKIVSSEDRRQALREETEATLQEVSRKGQEYQNYMLRVPADNIDGTEMAQDLSMKTTKETGVHNVQQWPQKETAESKHTSNLTKPTKTNEEQKNGDQKLCDENKTTKMEIVKATMQKQQYQEQPAESVSSTSNMSDNDNFMAPPALPIKPPQTACTPLPLLNNDPELLEPCAKQCQLTKTPHSAHIKLTMGKCGPQKRQCPSSQSELSDCGYGTQVENQESISTSSNDDDGPQSKPQHQKPPCSSKSRKGQRNILTAIDKKELRRKKLVKRSKSSLINMKGLVQHIPTDEDIANLLKEFTVDFLLKGYSYLVEDLHSQLLSNLNIPIDTSHFFWLVTYFLKFAAQLELDMEHVNNILTFEVISYLTYEGVMLCEQLELNSRQEGSDPNPYLRRMHLVVTAIREFLQAIETYKKVTHLSEEDRERLRLLQLQISSSEDLRNLFVLLLRRFNPSLHPKQYLQDLVVTNHMLLLILDSVTKSEDNVHIKMIDHVSQFATMEIMHFYGMLLDDFNSNGEFVNDCIFTMMHHIGGDLEQSTALFQPVILKTFSRIWEADYELCDDWSDLIEYVIHKFINTPQKSPLAASSASLTELTKEHNMETAVSTWTQEEMDTLYWYYVQSKKNNDVVGKIVKLFGNNGNKQKSRISIIQQLLQQDIITLVEYDDLMKYEDAQYQRTLLTTPTSGTTESGIEMKDTAAAGKPSDDIQILRDLIIKEKKKQHLEWLQKLLLECCYVKLILRKNPLREDHQNLSIIMEPVAYHSIFKNKSIPVVQWNTDQANTMMYQPFVLLLHKLGFQLPADAGSVYARIPEFWTPEMMFGLAKKLGPLEKLVIKFDVTQFDATGSGEKTAESKSGNMEVPTISNVSRNSLSSISSIDVELNDNDDLSTIPEMDDSFEKSSQTCEIFAVPKAKHSNSIIRYTPDPTSLPSVPNWLQLVIHSKCKQSTSVADSAAAAAAASLANLATNACIESDIWMSSTNDVVQATQITTNCGGGGLAVSQPSSSLLLAAAIPPSAAAVASAGRQHQTASTLLSCPSIIDVIVGQQHETIINNTTSNSDCKKLLATTITSTSSATTTKTTNTAAAETMARIGGNNRQQDIVLAATTLISLNSTSTLTTTPTAAIAAVELTTSPTTNDLISSTPVPIVHIPSQHQSPQQHHKQLEQLLQEQQFTQLPYSDDDDSAMKSLERNDSVSSGFCTRSGSGTLEFELSAMVASIYDQEITKSK